VRRWRWLKAEFCVSPRRSRIVDVKEIVERIRLLPEAFVDCGFRQGRDAFLRQLESRTGKDEAHLVDVYIEGCRETIAELVQRVAPYDIPDDYIFFLEFYGGLAIIRDDYYFALLGDGPMVEEWYGSVVSDEALKEPGKYGFLSLGLLSFRKGKYQFQYIDFFLDLAGFVRKHCVIGVGPWGQGTLTSWTILKDVHAHPDMWQKMANSFAEWLEQVAETRGSFGYI
jgi:hypothetical protein